MIILGLLGLVAAIAFLIGYIRLLSRLLIVEVPLAIESNLDATSTISRSWQLTKGYVSRIQWIVFVAFLITLPISIVIQIAQSLLQVALTAVLPTDSGIFVLLYFLLLIALTFASGSLLVPFWQAIKAIIYYDLRNRKEGMDLQIRNSR
jgi:membrane-anchored glycerophosphoryl diester phosphodiesterase (GDPDase)